MSYFEKAQKEAAERLKALLELPLPAETDDCCTEGYFNPWDAFPDIVPAYDSEIDRMAIRTLEAIRDRTTFALKQEGRHSLFVQFFFHVLAGHNYLDYGTSPGCGFPTYRGTDVLLDAWIEKWKGWYRIMWDEEFSAHAGTSMTGMLTTEHSS